jgi:uncharacterized protein YggL (DUF469 family)
MKKRLRKKTHKDEFAVFGRQVIVRRNIKDSFDLFLDNFIEIIEAHGCVCGGGGKEDHLDVVVELGRRDQKPDERMNAIEKVLRNDSSVTSIEIGEEFDVWNGNPQDLRKERN